ncbi:MAG: N-acetylmuramoyl-L-alanine amidase [Ignavibacteria bacterium]|nr:N-acetylmuramoyl-L-alanine amidase [Ignavibacteria bacterium]
MKLFFIIFLFACSIFSQSISKKTIEYNDKKANVSSFEKGNINYVSINDIAQLLNYNVYVNSKTKKIELKSEKETIKFSANNPFIVISARTNSENTIIQIPVSVLQIGNVMYMPFEYTTSILTRNMLGELRLSGENISSPFVVDEVKIPFEITPPNIPGKAVLLKSDIVINKVSIDEKTNGTLLKFRADKKIPALSHSIMNDNIIIKLKGSNVDAGKVDQTRGKSVVKEISTRNEEFNSIIEIALSKDYSSYEIMQGDRGNEILVTIHNKIFDRKIDKTSNKKDKWIFDVVVIDAGHGGKDYGAIGVNNTIEKEINLAISLKLGNLIKNNLKDIKVVYTRSDDRFIELYKRGKIANENNGKLFISIHCNSAPKKNSKPNGFEVYLLRPGRTAEAIGIAEWENSVIKYEDNPNRYQKLTDENFILVSMAHSTYMKYSEKFADLTVKQFEQNLKLASRGVKQAGFYVLVGASMPSVLVETGYVSNEKDARYLRSEQGQNEIAQSIFNSVKNFKTYYDQIIDVE